MGQEILYCSKCQTQLRSADFEKGMGVHLEGQAYCKKCARVAVSSLPAEKQAQILRKAEASKEADKALRGDHPPGSTTDRILKVISGRSPTRRSISGNSGSRQVLGVLAGLGAAAIGVVLLIEMAGGGSSPVPREKSSRSEEAIKPGPIPPPGDGRSIPVDQPRDPTIPAISLEKREQIANESLRQARDYAAAHPSDFAGQHSRFEEAAWKARETSIQETARVELKAVEKRELESFSAELSALDSKTREAQEGEQFAKALTLLDEAKSRHPGTGWAGEIERKVAQLNEAMTRRYASVKEKALEARKRGAQADLSALKERVKKWDMPAWAADLENSLTDAAKPPETPKPIPPEKAAEPLVPPPPKPPAGAPRTGRLPVPEATKQREAEAALKKAFNPDQAKTPKEKADLARTLLTAAAESGAKEAELYVLLRQARILAAQGGEVKTALEATNALVTAFEVDGASEKVDLFGRATVKGTDAVVWAASALNLATEASGLEDYETAIKLAGRAERLARAANDHALQTTTREAEKEYTELKRIADGVKAQMKTLEVHPEDAAASSAVGKYECLIRGDWKLGLALMAKGSDPDLKNLAELEQNATGGAAQAALGEAWLAQAGKEFTVYKSRAQVRAADWLRRAISGLSGMAKIAAERKLASLGSPDANRGRQILDLGGGVKLEFVAIKPGTFTMGGTMAPQGYWQPDEKPEHKVVLTKGFAMGKFPVTRGQFAAFVKATGYKTDAERSGKAWGRAPGGQWQEIPGNIWLAPAGFTQTDDHPVTCASWNDAKAFCDWATKVTGHTVTLPTEAEWEYACRAGTKTRWWFGDQEAAMVDFGWSHKNAGNQTHPVGQKRPNPWGLYDTYGPVSEWCQDISAPYSGEAVDPAGPTSGENRICRGGSWKYECISSATRGQSPPSNAGADIGFRVCLR